MQNKGSNPDIMTMNKFVVNLFKTKHRRKMIYAFSMRPNKVLLTYGTVRPLSMGLFLKPDTITALGLSPHFTLEHNFNCIFDKVVVASLSAFNYV